MYQFTRHLETLKPPTRWGHQSLETLGPTGRNPCLTGRNHQPRKNPKTAAAFGLKLWSPYDMHIYVPG